MLRVGLARLAEPATTEMVVGAALNPAARKRPPAATPRSISRPAVRLKTRATARDASSWPAAAGAIPHLGTQPAATIPVPRRGVRDPAGVPIRQPVRRASGIPAHAANPALTRAIHHDLEAVPPSPRPLPQGH
jgi:hypothetical protein